MAFGKIDADDGERLPWLETAEDYDNRGPSVLHIVLVVAALLAVIVAAILGYHLLRSASDTGGNGALIAAQEGDYKVRPDEPGGLKVEGEGDSAIATSNGEGSGNAAINVKALPEAPIVGKKAAPTVKEGAGASKAVVALPPSHGKLEAKPTTPPVARGTAGGSLVQLGAFPSEAAANAAWTKLSGRIPYLAPLGKAVQVADVNGTTTYRLRVNAGSPSQASELCGKLKVAGEACFVARD